MTDYTIHGLCEEDDFIGVARHLIDHPDDVNAIDDEDSVPLTIAMKNGNLKLIALLLAHGADPNTTHGLFDSTPLASCLWGDDHWMSMLPLLMTFGASMDQTQPDHVRDTPREFIPEYPEMLAHLPHIEWLESILARTPPLDE